MATRKHNANDIYDGISAKLLQARAICSLAAAAPDSQRNQIPDDAMSDGMWAARDLLDEAREMTNKLREMALEVKHD